MLEHNLHTTDYTPSGNPPVVSRMIGYYCGLLGLVVEGRLGQQGIFVDYVMRPVDAVGVVG